MSPPAGLQGCPHALLTLLTSERLLRALAAGGFQALVPHSSNWSWSQCCRRSLPGSSSLQVRAAEGAAAEGAAAGAAVAGGAAAGLKAAAEAQRSEPGAAAALAMTGGMSRIGAG